MSTTPSIRVLVIEGDAGRAAHLATLDADAPSALPRLAVQRATTLAEAEAAIEGSRVDVILIDPDLPDGAGIAAVERIRRAAGDAVPIVLLLSHPHDPVGLAVETGLAQDALLRTGPAPMLHRVIRHARERDEWRRMLLEREAALRQSHKMEAIGRLAGGIAHDFNNVLTAIFGYADLLLDQFEPDDPRRADLLEIRQSAERAAMLTRQLLAFSRKQVMQPSVLNLNAVIAVFSELLVPLVGGRITVAVEAAPDLWTVRADRSQIEQVLMNLAANARDAMPDGGTLTIATANHVVDEEDPRRRPGLRPGAYVTVSVSDTGTGMSDTVRVHMFEPFFTTKEQGLGAGLGLSTVYGIIKQMEGGVYAETEKGKGTRLVIYLPRVPSEQPS